MHVDVWGHAGARVIVFPTTMGTWREWPDRRMPEVLVGAPREGLDPALLPGPGARRELVREAPAPGRAGLAPPAVRRLRVPRGAAVLAVAQRQPVRHRDRGQLRRLPRRDLRVPPPGRGEPDHRHERAVRHQAHDRRLLRPATCTPATRSTSCGTSGRQRGWRRCGGRTSSSPSGGTTRPTRTTPTSPAILWDKGIGNALRVWDGHAHDWPFWEKMIRTYMAGATD